jgi:hypothetical protein
MFGNSLLWKRTNVNCGMTVHPMVYSLGGREEFRMATHKNVTFLRKT